MLSPGGKVEWLCPECRSSRLSQTPIKVGHFMRHEGLCLDCKMYFPWRYRIKIGKKKRLERLLKGKCNETKL